APELLVKPFEYPPRPFHAVTRAGQGDVVTALLGNHAEPTLDQRQVLPVLAEQQGCEPVILERQHDLRRSTVAGERSAVCSRGAQRFRPPASLPRPTLRLQIRRTGCCFQLR